MTDAVAKTVYARKLATLDEVLRPLATYLEDRSVVEIMLNSDGSVRVEWLQHAPRRVDVTFAPGPAERLARAIAAIEGVELNDLNPSIACVLPRCGSRVQILAPPIVDAVTVVIRRHSALVLPLSEYVEKGILKPGHARALERAVLERLNILVSGGTGSGKTTFLNTLLALLAASTDRVYTIEDTRELRLEVADRVSVRVIKGLYSWRDAVTDSLRMRPDRIIVGEVREGGSALELLKALNTGHPGSIASLHCNSAALALDRYCELLAEVVAAPPRATLAEIMHVCVHMRRDDSVPAGRVVTGVVRVRGFVSADRDAPLTAEQRCSYERQGITLQPTQGGYWLLEDMEED